MFILRNKIKILTLVALLFFCFGTSHAMAALSLKDAFKVTGGSPTSGNSDPLDKAASTGGFNTNGADTQLTTFIASIIQTFLSILGVLFLVLTIYGGFLWMTARGNQSQVDKARDLIAAAVVGLAIVVGAYVITYFVVESVSSKVLKTSVESSSDIDASEISEDELWS